ncbi:MAG: metallopeptidase TldD-related protein [Candidatus Bathyarchaeia archaeon]
MKSPSGIVDVVVGGEVAGLIAHESCGHPCEADRILGGDATFIVKDGKIKKAAKGLRITGRLYELLSPVEYSTDRCY